MDPRRPSESDPIDRLVELPGFAGGGRVDRTGIALVHEGEYILPAAGSEAAISDVGAGSRGGSVINYYFPIEVEVVGALSASQLRLVADHVVETIDAALRQRTG
jgi:hypothetical protein